VAQPGWHRDSGHSRQRGSGRRHRRARARDQGAVIFFLIEPWFGATGVWYLIGLGATALPCSLFVPRGIWGSLEDHVGIRLLPVGYRLKSTEATAKPPEP